MRPATDLVCGLILLVKLLENQHIGLKHDFHVLSEESSASPQVSVELAQLWPQDVVNELTHGLTFRLAVSLNLKLLNSHADQKLNELVPHNSLLGCRLILSLGFVHGCLEDDIVVNLP
jgi:hypothetical protein